MFYTYKRGASGLGIGVENLALIQPQTLPAFNPYSARYVARRSMQPQAPGYVKTSRGVLPVALVGNGAMLSGQLALQRLAELETL